METNFFNNVGILTHKFSDDELFQIRQEVNTIRDDFDSYENCRYNYDLAGNISREYKLTKTRDYIDSIITPLINKFDNEFNYKQLIISCGKNLPDMTLGEVWVNFQKKYEFNPIHTHPGVFGFVIYLDIPYSFEEEFKVSPGNTSNKNLAGQIQFVYNNSIGQLCTQSIPTDNRMTNYCIVFPAGLSHCVYPFYSSDNYRISVAGNYIPKI